MAVTVFLTSGERRVVWEGDAARMEGAFFMVTRWDVNLQRVENIVTLRSKDVVGAEIRNAGEVSHVLGAGVAPKA